MSVKKEVPFSVILPKEVRTAIRAEAKRQDVPSSHLVRKILVAWFDFNRLNKGNLTNGEESQEGKTGQKDGQEKIEEVKT